MKADQAELLALLVEECGEAVQMVGKCLRHGLDKYNPFDPMRRTNRELLTKELGDVLAAISLLAQDGVLELDKVDDARRAKLARIGQYLHKATVRPTTRNIWWLRKEHRR